MAWTLDALDRAWHPSHWRRPAPEPHTGWPLPELGLVAAIAGLHIADHTVIDERHHVAVHLGTAAGAVVAALAMGASPTELGLRPDRAGRGLRRGAGVSTALTLGIAAAALHPTTRGYFLDDRVMDVSRREIAQRSLVHIPFGTAVYEEVVFRGVLLGLALRRLPPLPAAAVTSVLFGFWHVFPALADHGANPTSQGRGRGAHVAGTVVTTALAGMAFAWERLRTNSVVAPIMTHATINAVTYALAATVAARHRPDGSPAPADELDDELRRSSGGP